MAEAGTAPASGGERENEEVGEHDDLTRLRAALLRAYPETIDELVTGDSVGALLDSLDRAGAAYRRVADRLGASEPGTAARPAPPPVPAGDARPLALDPDALPAVEKIRRGLAGRA